jgi:hypothetical protein
MFHVELFCLPTIIWFRRRFGERNGPVSHLAYGCDTGNVKISLTAQILRHQRLLTKSENAIAEILVKNLTQL